MSSSLRRVFRVWPRATCTRDTHRLFGAVWVSSATTGWPKNWHNFLYASTSTSSNIDRFSNLFHFLNHENICHNTTTKDPTTPQVCRYTTLWNVSGLKATIKNNTTSVTQHFRKINNRNQHVYCLKVTFASHSANFTSNHSNVQCVRLVAGRRTLKMCYYRRHLVFNCCF